MADDIIKTHSIKESTKELEDLKKALDGLSQADKLDTTSVQNFGKYSKQAAMEHQGLVGVIKEATAEIWNEAKSIGSLESQIRDVSSSMRGFIGTLKSTISISSVHNRLLAEMRKGQQAYSASLNASTKQLGEASVQSQKYIDMLHNSYASAKSMAGEYGVAAEDLIQLTDNLVQSFGTQLGAMDDQTLGLEELRAEVFQLSRFMGVDASESVQRLQERFKGSQKTIEELRSEYKRVGMAVDTYTQKIQEMGKWALKTGNVTKKEFLGVLGQIRGEFRSGIYDAEGFSKSLGNLFVKAKEGGLTANEIKGMGAGLGTLISGMAKFENIFGVKAAQSVEKMMGNLDQIEDEGLKRRLKYVQESGAFQDPISRLQAIVEASRGSAEGTAILVKSLRQTMGDNMPLLVHYAKEQGGMGALQAGVMAKMIASGELERQFQKTATKEAGQKREEELSAFESTLKEFTKEATTPAKTQYKMAKDVEELKMKTIAFMEKYPLMMAGIMAGAGIAGNLLGGGLQGILMRRGLTGALGRLGLGGAGAAGRGVAGTVVSRGGMAAAGAGGMGLAGGALNVLGAGVGGYMVGTALDKLVGSILTKRLGGDVAATVGKDTTLSSLIGATALDEKTRGQITRLSGEEYQNLKKLQKVRQKQIADLEKRESELDSLGKSRLEALRKEVKKIQKRTKRRDSLMETEAELRERMLQDQYKAILKQLTYGIMGPGFKGKKFSDVGALKEHLKSMIMQDSRLWKYGGSEKAFRGFLGSTESGMLMKEAGRLGLSREDVATMFERSKYEVAKLVSEKSPDDIPTWYKKLKGAPIALSEEHLRARSTEEFGRATKGSIALSISGDDDDSSMVQDIFHEDGTREEITTTTLKVTGKKKYDYGKRAMHYANYVNKLKNVKQGTPNK